MNKFKYLLFISVFVAILLLTGCGKKELSKEELLCQTMTPYFEKYETNQITYGDLLNSIKPDYDNYCTENKHIICKSLYLMYNSIGLEDCSKYSLTMKEICETNNNTKQIKSTTHGDVQTAEIDNLKRLCKKLEEE